MTIDTRGGIGLVGLGGITPTHLNGYAHFGLPVVAGYDIASQARSRFAGSQPQATVYDELDALLDDPKVAFIDLAAPYHRAIRLPTVQKLAQARKPVLFQKPFAMYYQDALEFVETLEATGTVGMVNQNMCFTPGGLALAPVVVEQKPVGEPFLAQMEVREVFDFSPDGWQGKDERWWTLGMTVHHLSFLHLLFGAPERVYAVMGRDPKQSGVAHESFGQLMLSYASGLHITLLSTGAYYGKNPVLHTQEEFWIQGPDGIIDWQPENGYSITLRANRGKTDLAERHQFTATSGRWFPEAFGLTMAHLQQAVAAHAEPLCSVQDNLYVIAAMEAAYRSAQSGHSVRLAEIMGARYQREYGPGWLHGYRAWQSPHGAACLSHSQDAAD